MSPGNAIRILIVDDDPTTRRLVGMVLSGDKYDVVESATGEAALEATTSQEFQLAIVDIMLPGMDGFALCRALRQHPSTRTLPILLLTAKDSLNDKMVGFEAGANDYLVKPFHPTELTYRVKSLLAGKNAVAVPGPAPARGQAICIFGTKGGTGKTMLSVNLAIAFSELGKRTALFDADLFFGDAGEHLNLPPSRSIMDWVTKLDTVEPGSIDSALVTHTSGIHVLLSPFRPEQSDRVSPNHMKQTLTALTARYDFVVVDCPASYEERVLAILDQADVILLVVTPEIGSLKSMRIFLEVSSRLGLDSSRFRILLNRFDSNVGIKPEEIERALQRDIYFRLASGGRAVALSINRGVPILIGSPNHALSQQIRRIASALVPAPALKPTLPPSKQTAAT